MDHIDPICPFDASQYTGTPDAEPCERSLPVRERIAKLDALYTLLMDRINSNLKKAERSAQHNNS